MGLGVAALVTAQKNESVPGPPFAAGSADNGLSVDTVAGKIVLGNDIGAPGSPAKLLSAREIEMLGNLFRLINNGFRKFIVDPGGGLYALGDLDTEVGGMRVVVLDAAGQVLITSATANILNGTVTGNNPVVSIGDDTAVGNNTYFTVDDINKVLAGFSGGFEVFQLDTFSGFPTVLLGDVNGAANQTGLSVDDNLQEVKINALNGLKMQGNPNLIENLTAYANGAGANVGTLNNAPTAGDPTKWIPIIDNGITRYIPAW